MNGRKGIWVYLAAALLVLMTAANGFAFISGDVDDDGRVRLADALLVLRSIAGTETLTPAQITACNVNNDFITIPPYEFGGTQPNCDLIDAVLILRKAYGLMN